MKKPCEWCEAEMEVVPRGIHIRFCSNRCRQAAKYARVKGTHKFCENCGKTFKFKLESQRTCSPKCRRQLKSKEKRNES